ncbi:MAG: helix-turn-helix domain-containing protein [Gammaproteobacteria bacterium]|nr:helix-turn-helix domain-containing protein [Gammaproteobacteria bacterium]MBU1602030.1 helix-turn-helix domain-containing protein [Gammaproteobacteria bacterium]MBU2434007.1 helix-turn-helix domain-containing protein [Gammaproteobacteria bacterium]MBU2447831.1 helix-turn-helix domain-containing protein [Gammaproteobacteria bacterium]
MANSLHRPQYEVFRKMMVKARETAGLTQVQIADALGRPQSFVSKYERGDRRLDFTEFVEITAILGIDVAAFITAYQDSINDLNLRPWVR